MMVPDKAKPRKLTRREFLLTGLVAGTATATGAFWGIRHFKRKALANTFIASVPDYNRDFKSIIGSGFKELGIGPREISGKKILLKPNLIEPVMGMEHICTHPNVVRGAIEAFYALGAEKVLVGEGSGHSRDTYRILDESGMTDTLLEDRIPFVDLNNDDFTLVKNLGGHTDLSNLAIPKTIVGVDWVVSMPKMKTHHWAGVTLSMKNLFGVMPGIVYGYPKNVFHYAGIEKSILDINLTLKPDFAIVDGVVGMEGDGPIMGDPKNSGVVVMGRNPLSVDATCCRIMGINPEKVPYLKAAASWFGSIHSGFIKQLGENISTVQNKFNLLEKIPIQKTLI